MGNKANSKQLLIKSGFWYTISNFLTRAMVFITMPVFTRLMTKAEYGDFYVFASWQSILLIICGLELYGTLNRARFDFPESTDFDGYISSSLVLSTILTAVVFVVYILLSNLLGHSFLLDKKYMCIMFAYLFFCPALSMFQTKQRVTYKYRLSAAISIVLSISSSLLALRLAVRMSEDRLLGRIIGQYGLPTIVGVIFYFYFFAQSRRITLASWRYAIRMGAPLVISSLGSQLMLTSDGLVLKYLCSAEEVSYLSVTQTASHIVLILVQTLNSAWAPWFYDMLKEDNNEEIRKSFLIYVWGIVICTFALLLIGPEVISILGGKGYGDSVLILPPCILSGIFTALTAQLVNLEVYHKKPEYAAVLTGLTSVANVILDVLVVKIWGYRAVCYATVFCQILLITLHYFKTTRLGVRSLLSEKDLVILLFASIMLIPVALVVYQSIIIRCAAIVISICIALSLVFANKEEIISFVNSIRRG